MRKLSELINSPLVRSYFASLLGVGYDSDRERSLNKTLVVATIFLTIASGYTTWVGLDAYVPGLIAFFLTLGLQGLVFASSWRLGASINTRAFRIPLLIIFVVTVVTSVFFSYAALLDNVYRPKAREHDQLQRGRLTGSIIAADLAKRQEAVANARLKTFRALLSQWHTSATSATSGLLARKASEVARVNSEHDLLLRTAQRETDTGGTRVTINGRLWVTPSGHGDYARSYESEADTYLFKTLAPAQKTFADMLAAAGQVDALTDKMIRSTEEVTPANVAELSSARERFLALLRLDASGPISAPDIPANLLSESTDIERLTTGAPAQDATATVAAATSVDSIKGELLERVRANTVLDLPARTQMLQRVDDIDNLSGPDVHPFALAYGELRRGNILALGSLIVAIAIDGLIFMCGLLAARPQSYLDMRSPSDLYNIQEVAIETVMALDLDDIDLSLVRSPFVKRGVSLLRRAEVDVELAYDGFTAVVSAEAAHDLRMIEVGLLLALDLARELADGRLAFRTRFVLWLADKVERGTIHETTLDEIVSTFNGEYPI
ncbi:MAG TPA: hypothetical protein VN380_20205 [Thermoanaerobaculia bacterium]|nr:hypothetical protein [Thermoanaerobaculia bacterium]